MADGEGERGDHHAAAQFDSADFEQVTAADPLDLTQLLSALGLRNATGDKGAQTGSLTQLSEIGESIAAFGELIAVMRVTCNLIDDDVLEALIVRLAELLGIPLPLAR